MRQYLENLYTILINIGMICFFGYLYYRTKDINHVYALIPSCLALAGSILFKTGIIPAQSASSNVAKIQGNNNNVNQKNLIS